MGISKMRARWGKYFEGLIGSKEGDSTAAQDTTVQPTFTAADIEQARADGRAEAWEEARKAGRMDAWDEAYRHFAAKEMELMEEYELGGNSYDYEEQIAELTATSERKIKALQDEQTALQTALVFERERLYSILRENGLNPSDYGYPETPQLNPSEQKAMFDLVRARRKPTWQQELFDYVVGETVFPENLNEIVEQLLDTLALREAEVLRMRFEQKMTLKQIGEELRVSQERIRGIIQKAVRKLQHPSRMKRLFRGVADYNAMQDELRAALAQCGEREKALIAERDETIQAWTTTKQRYELILQRCGISDVVLEAPEYVYPTPQIESVWKRCEMTIEEFDLSVRSYNCLKRGGVNTVGELLDLDNDELAKIRNLGKKSLDEVLWRLDRLFADLGPNWREIVAQRRECERRHLVAMTPDN